MALIATPGFASIACLALGISMIPYFFDRISEEININLDKSSKVGVRIALFFLFVIAVNIESTDSTGSETDGASIQFEKVASSALLNSSGNVSSEDSITLIKFVNLSLDGLTEEEYDNLINNELDKQILADSTSNSLLIEKMNANAKSLEDFESEKEYWTYRARRSYGLVDLGAFNEHLSKAAKMKGDHKIAPILFEHLINYKKQSGDLEGNYEICKIALKDDSQNTKVIMLLADLYFSKKKYKSAIKYYKQYLKINATNPVIHTKVGIAYEATRNKSKAKAHYQSAIDLEGSGGQACERLRELTVKIVDYSYYSECCDGTTSSSTGRGTCSHHGGVCRTMKRPITRYTIDCN
jgi:tetratricopeptide (TPR) repeat protein